VKKLVKILFAAVIVMAMAAMAWYSLLDKKQAVTERPYAGGDFAYTGALRNGLFDGSGEIAFANGARYTGGFLKGRAAGGFVYTPAGDWRFEGEFSNGKPYGTIYLPGDVAVAVSQEDVAALVSPKGWEYEGGIGERGQNGEGTFTFRGGESYTGGFLLGLAGGRGTYRGADGSVIYEGEWKAGLYHGQGRYASPDGRFAYEGAFEAGLPHGLAAYSEGGTLRYSGEFQGGVPQGQGKYYSPGGWTYEGGFVNGLFHGQGTLTRDGKSVTAQWVKGRRAAGEE